MAEQQPAPRLGARNLHYTVNADGAPLRVLHGVSLDLRAGDIATVSGPSGAGKSSLLWVLARMHAADSGALFLDGKPAAEFTAPQWRARVALAIQNPKLVDGSVQRNLSLPWTLGVRAGHTAPSRHDMHLGMHSMGLGDVDITRDAADLSGGQAARVALLRTLLTQPDILLLDEPTASLDDESADLVFACIRQFAARGGAVLAVLHQRTPGGPHRALHLENGILTGEGAGT
jgi:putative ABC transport system ATP-binding protein